MDLMVLQVFLTVLVGNPLSALSQVKAVQGMGDPDACNERGLRALQLSIAKGHLGMVCLLLERSVAPETGSGHGEAVRSCALPSQSLEFGLRCAWSGETDRGYCPILLKGTPKEPRDMLHIGLPRTRAWMSG